VRSWRPALLAAVSVFVLNLVVLILKVALGRGQPAAADPSFFVGGMAYPSGHTANMGLVYGLAVYLLGRYRRIDRRVVTVLWSVVVLLSVIMVATSLALDWHWFADLIAGLLVGGTVLQLSVAADVATGRTLFDDGPRAAWRELRSRQRHRRHARPPEPPTLLLEPAPRLQRRGHR
jgi:undecaprenyl-diphosphatase